MFFVYKLCFFCVCVCVCALNDKKKKLYCTEIQLLHYICLTAWVASYFADKEFTKHKLIKHDIKYGSNDTF